MARLFVVVSLLAAALALSPTASTHADQTIASWDFEQQSDIDQWRWLNGEFARVPDPLEPDHAARLTADEAPAALSVVRTVEVTPGASYRFSGRALLNDTAARFLRLEVQWTRPDGRFFWKRAELTPLAGGYRTATTPDAPIPCNVAQAQVVLVLQRNGHASASAVVDDLRLELVGGASCPPLPPPPTEPPRGAPPTATPRPGGPPGPDDPPGGGSTTPDPGGTAVSGTAQNLLANPGFELAAGGRPLAWDDYGGVLLRVGSPARSGRFAGGFSSASSSTKWAHQTVRVRPTAWYEFEAHLWMSDPRVEVAFLRISWYASADGSGGAVATADSTETLERPRAAYRRLTTGAVQAPPGVHSARARVMLRPRSPAGAAIYIDDAAFRPTSAPGVDSGAGASSGDVGAGAGPSSSGGGGDGASSVLGARAGVPPLDAAPYPTPVIVRNQRVAPSIAAPSGDTSRSWWPWALAGGGALAVGGGGAWWWRRKTASKRAALNG